MATEPTKTEGKKDAPEWGGFKGTIVKDSLKEVDGKLEATGVTAEGKEHKIVAYPHQKNGAEALKAAHDSGAEMVFRGPMLGSAKKGTFHFGAAVIKAPGEKAPELSAEEKAAKKEKAAADREAAIKEKDASRVLVAGGFKAEEVEIQGVSVAVSRVSRDFDLDEKALARIQETWPDTEFSVGDKVAYAEFDKEELEAKLSETPEPSM